MTKREPPADRHAPIAMLRLHSVGGHCGTGREWADTDPIETACPLCILEWRDGGWRHDRSCILAPRG